MTTYDTIILFAEYERQKGRETMKTTPIELSFATTTRPPNPTATHYFRTK